MHIDKWTRSVAVLIAALALASCDGGGYDESDEPEPRAVASAVGQEFTTDANGVMRMTVRAGAEVVLSGKNSSKGADDSGLPLIDFDWQQVAPMPTGVDAVHLVNRTANTVSFVAPQVVQDNSELRFRLTVKDAKGAASSTEAVVTVRNIRDQDRFLQFLDGSNSIGVELATTSDIAPGTRPANQLTVSLKITKLVTFRDRLAPLDDPNASPNNTPTFTRIPIGKPVIVSGSWAPEIGAFTACGSAATPSTRNPVIQIPIPRLDLDEEFPKISDPATRAQFSQEDIDALQSLTGSETYRDATILSDVIEASDVDKATMEIRIDQVPTAAVTAVLCVPGTALSPQGTPVSAPAQSVGRWVIGTRFSSDVLQSSSLRRDSKQDATEYYERLDPGSQKTRNTLAKWLQANAFDVTAPDWGTRASNGAHAIYTNNYDLGFGRDMYLKIGDRDGNCDSGFTATSPAQTAIGKCDVAAVVVNYSDIEATAKKLNPIVAVAMEYSRYPGVAPTDPRFVKFYTYAPDRRTGEFKRVLSVNLDRRGEQFMPQACVVCHGGIPGATGYPTLASTDVGATFLPWDLESFLYSDTDPGFSKKSRDSGLRATYSRSRQEAEFKALNRAAYLTYSDPGSIPGRYAVARELVEKWYGGTGAANSDPLPGSQFVNSPPVPTGWLPGINGNPTDSDRIYRDVFARNCRMCHAMHLPSPSTSGTCSASTPIANSNGQLQMGCYWHFAHAPKLEQHLSGAQMPFARRTMDRMWTDQLTTGSGSPQTPGQLLATHLLGSTPSLVVTTPGTVKACIDDPSAELVAGTTKFKVARNGKLSLYSSCSRYLPQQIWAVTDPDGQAAAVVGARTSAPYFYPIKEGDYAIALSDGTGASTSKVANVEKVAPQAPSGSITIPLLAPTGFTIVDVTERLVLTGPLSRDPIAAVLDVTADSGLTIATRANDPTLLPTQIRITTNTLAARTLRFRLRDSDGDTSPTVPANSQLGDPGTIVVRGSAGLSIASPTITIVALPNEIGKVIDIGNGIGAGGYISNPAQQPISFAFTVNGIPSTNTVINTIRRTVTFAANWYPNGPNAAPFGSADPNKTQVLGLGRVELLNLGTGRFTYNAPLRLLSHSQTNQVGPLDGFSFQACFVGQPETGSNCVSAQVRIQITGSQSFTSLRTSLVANCSNGCHASGQNGSILAMAAANVDPAHAAYCRLRGLSDTGNVGNEPLNTAYLDLATPTSSLLYRKPQSTSNTSAGGAYPAVVYHGGSIVAAAPLTAISDWITQGAYFTEGNESEQSCP